MMRTINIVEILDGKISSILSYNRDSFGERASKDAFKRILRGLDLYNDEEIEEFYNSGSFDDDNGYSVQIKYGLCTI